MIREPVDKEGLVGTLFRPDAPGPRPAVVLLGGVDGALMEGTAAVLASEGYAALALAYFGVDPLPRELAEIPLEYFERTISWLRAQPNVQSGRVAVMGVSKGGELAVLLGATYPEHVGAVVGYSASSIVWRGGPYGPQSLLARPRSSWMLRGEPLPFVDPKPRLSEILGTFVGKFPDARAIHQRALEDIDAVASATIRAEKIDGPVLLVSHADDRLWPATRLSEMVMERLRAHGHPFPYEHLSYEDAGHPGGLPYSAPVTIRMGLWYPGGSLGGNGLANADSWTKMLAFLEKHFKQRADTSGGSH